MVTTTLPYKTTITKFYIAEPKTPLDNQLQYKSHIVRNLFLSRHKKPRTKKVGHPKLPQPDIPVENQQAKSQSKIEVNLTKIYYITEKKQFEGQTTTKHNSRNEEYKTAKRTRRKPRRLVVTTAITTRKR